MGFISSFIKRIRIKWYSSTNERKIKYLRTLGTKIGESTRISCDLNFVGSEPYLIEIGSDCLLTQGLHLITHDGGVKVLNSANYFHGKKMDKIGRIKIGNNVYTGNYVTIMPNVVIGDNVIIGINSVVTKSVPSNVVVAGMPAKIICTIEEFYKKNMERGVFIPTAAMSYDDKKEFLIKNIPNI